MKLSPFSRGIQFEFLHSLFVDSLLLLLLAFPSTAGYFGDDDGDHVYNEDGKHHDNEAIAQIHTKRRGRLLREDREHQTGEVQNNQDYGVENIETEVDFISEGSPLDQVEEEERSQEDHETGLSWS